MWPAESCCTTHLHLSTSIRDTTIMDTTTSTYTFTYIITTSAFTLYEPEVTLPPWKRLCIALGLRFEVGDSSSTPTARPTGGFRADYGIFGTLDDEIRRDLDVSTTVRDYRIAGSRPYTTDTASRGTDSNKDTVDTGYTTKLDITRSKNYYRSPLVPWDALDLYRVPAVSTMLPPVSTVSLLESVPLLAVSVVYGLLPAILGGDDVGKGIGRSGGIHDGGVSDRGIAGSGGDDTGKGGDTGNDGEGI
nr:hypothetical protein [Tanacetum cinerariifolium]